jgi:hypothetical protein
MIHTIVEMEQHQFVRLLILLMFLYVLIPKEKTKKNEKQIKNIFKYKHYSMDDT